MPRRAQLYIGGLVATGASVLVASLANWSSPHPITPVAYLTLAVLASLLKLRLPGIQATYSLSFLFLLFGILHFILAETVMAACVADWQASLLVLPAMVPSRIHVSRAESAAWGS